MRVSIYICIYCIQLTNRRSPHRKLANFTRVYMSMIVGLPSITSRARWTQFKSLRAMAYANRVTWASRTIGSVLTLRHISPNGPQAIVVVVIVSSSQMVRLLIPCLAVPFNIFTRKCHLAMTFKQNRISTWIVVELSYF